MRLFTVFSKVFVTIVCRQNICVAFLTNWNKIRRSDLKSIMIFKRLRNLALNFQVIVFHRRTFLILPEIKLPVGRLLEYGIGRVFLSQTSLMYATPSEDSLRMPTDISDIIRRCVFLNRREQCPLQSVFLYRNVPNVLFSPLQLAHSLIAHRVESLCSLHQLIALLC